MAKSQKKEDSMLNVYAAEWCPHCRATMEYLRSNNIPFEYHNIEKQSEKVLNKIIEVNGGDDWVVPTLEYNGKWRPGKVFNPEELEHDIKKMGL